MTLRPSCSNDVTAAPIDIPRACSSGSKSQTVEPSVTEPSRLMIPDSNRIASARLVLPLPRCPIRATLRIRSGARCPIRRRIYRGEAWKRERLVVALYYYENLTLREIGEVLDVTESRVSQLHTKAVMRLKSGLQQV